MTTMTMPTIYSLMADDVLWASARDLERIVSQPAFRLTAASTQNFYLEKLDQVRCEIEKRRT
jgi:dGTP triphosphohydrolase